MDSLLANESLVGRPRALSCRKVLGQHLAKSGRVIGLRKEGGAARLDRFVLVSGRRCRGDRHDRYVLRPGLLAEELDDRPSVELGKLQVEQDQVRTVLAGELQGREPIGRDGGLMSGVANDAESQLEVVWFVLDDEDLGHP